MFGVIANGRVAVLLLFLAVPPPAMADGGGLILSVPPSSALYAPKKDGVRLVRSHLGVFCLVRVCDVQFTFDLNAKKAVSSRLYFISPEQRAAVSVNDKAVKTTNRFMPPESDGEKSAAPWRRIHPNGYLLKTRFNAGLKKGRNRVIVKFRQQLSIQSEMGRNLKRGKYLKYLQFELWPIKRWQAAQDKKVVPVLIELRMKRRQPGFFGRYLGRKGGIKCQGVNVKACDAPWKWCHSSWVVQGEGKEQEDLASYSMVFKDTLPDRLYCRVHDSHIDFNMP